MEEDAREAGRADVAQVVVFAVQAVGELDVLELVHERVDGHFRAVAEMLVDGPHADADGHGLGVDLRRVLVQVVLVLVDIARAVLSLFV